MIHRTGDEVGPRAVEPHVRTEGAQILEGGAEGRRARAFDAAPAVSGDIDGQPFEWIADADMRLGPMLEAVVNGRYFWMPFSAIARAVFEPPADLRDAVWTPGVSALLL